MEHMSIFIFEEIGGGNRDRTDDLLHAMQALSQLSYTPTIEVSGRGENRQRRPSLQAIFPKSEERPFKASRTPRIRCRFFHIDYGMAVYPY
jgi:hypothetical protein